MVSNIIKAEFVTTIILFLVTVLIAISLAMQYQIKEANKESTRLLRKSIHEMELKLYEMQTKVEVVELLDFDRLHKRIDDLEKSFLLKE